MHDQRTGYFMVVLAALFWAVSGTAARFLFLEGMTAFQLVQLRMTLAAVVLTVMLFFRKSLLRCGPPDLLLFLIFGITLAIMQFTYLFAISRVPVAAAVLLQYQAPVFIALYGLIFLRRQVSQSLLAALVMAVAGCYFMVGGSGLEMASMDRTGVIAGLVSAFAFAVYSLLGEQVMSRYSSSTAVCYALLVGAGIWNIVQPPLSAFREIHGPATWLLIFFIAIGGTIIPFWLYTEGVQLITAARASITATLEPVFAGLAAYLLLDEVMLPLQILGGCMILSALLILQLKRNVSG